MRYVSKNILSRVICFAFGMSLGIYQIAQGFFTGHIGVLFFGIGMVLLGVVWFLQPFVFGTSWNLILIASREASLAPKVVRTVLVFAGLGALWVGLILQYGYGV